MSNRTSTFVSEVFACWPPGPPLRLNRHRSSDAAMTRVVDGILVKVMSWYDNEYGYANQMLREARSVIGAGEPEPAKSLPHDR